MEPLDRLISKLYWRMRAEEETAMKEPTVSFCRSCKARIWWLKNNVTGRLAPINAASDPSGNIVLVDEKTYAVIAGDVAEGMHDGERYLNHFATCPNAKQHHKEKAK